MSAPYHPASGPTSFAALPPPARLVIAALRAARLDLARSSAWEDGELLALCDAAGLRRDAAARLGACVVLLLREARSPPCVGPPGSAGVTGDELALVEAIAAMQAGRPWQAQQVVRRWLPTRRQVQGIALLAVPARDLAVVGIPARTRPSSVRDAER